MLRVGLTGGIGSGKSTVARRLAARGAVVVDADRLAREVVAPGTEGLAEVVDAFGPEVVHADGSLDRAALGRTVFGDAGARGRLEAITHPRIRALTEQRFRAAPADAVVVHDIPLLVELGFEDRYHLSVVVHTDVEERVRRLVQGRGSTEAEARSRIAAQADARARRAAADVWLDNTTTEADLLDAVDDLWRERLVPFEANVRLGRRAEAGRFVELFPAEPGWAGAGRRLAARVARAAGGAALAVEHIGPTSVPGLPAQDVVDLQLVVADLARADATAADLARVGFPRVLGPASGPRTPVRGAGDAAGEHRAERLHGSADPARPVELHVRRAGSPEARYALLLRDWLRADEAARREYEAEERRLALLHPLREEHAAAQEPWLVDVARPRMEQWAAATGWTAPA